MYREPTTSDFDRDTCTIDVSPIRQAPAPAGATRQRKPSSLARVRRWSTDDVARGDRLAWHDRACAATSFARTTATTDTEEFRSDVRSIDVGPLTIVELDASACEATRSREHAQGQPLEKRFHLLMCRNASWRLVHRGEARLAPGDAILVDTRMEITIDIGSAFEMIDIGMTESWIRQWIVDPGRLVGRRLCANGEGWSRALTSFLGSLSPSFLATAPLPCMTIVEQVGAMLALATADRSPPADADVPTVPLPDRISDCISSRCTELSLTVSAVAAALDISARTVHRNLAALGTTFGAALQLARVQAAARMLESPRFQRLTVAEIGRRAGFCDPSHFARSFFRVCGRTPSRVRGAMA